jgi:hypothetical protein
MILEFVGLLFFLGFIATRSLEAAETEPEALFIAAGAEHRSLTLVSVSPLVVEDKILGALIVYDNPTTKRPADYFELYDSDDDLLAVGWFDRFGIQRMAVDRGLLERGDELEGVFVSLLDGDSI